MSGLAPAKGAGPLHERARGQKYLGVVPVASHRVVKELVRAHEGFVDHAEEDQLVVEKAGRQKPVPLESKPAPGRLYQERDLPRGLEVGIGTLPARVLGERHRELCLEKGRGLEGVVTHPGRLAAYPPFDDRDVQISELADRLPGMARPVEAY